MTRGNETGDGLDVLRPTPTPLTRFFWDGAARHELWIQRCCACGLYAHPPKPVCRRCHSRDVAGTRVSGRARLYSWTIATRAFHPHFEADVPFVLASVELIEQPRLMLLSRVVDCSHDELAADLALEATFQDLVPGVTVPVFRRSGQPNLESDRR